MATHQCDVSVSLRVPADVPVPDVVLLSEKQAMSFIEAAGLEPGRRIPAPRPANDCSEVVIRTHPGVGSIVQAGTLVDYEMLPGKPRERTRPSRYVDYDAASSLDAACDSHQVDVAADERQPCVDFDVIDTLFRIGCQPVEGRA